jgi:hypothetical protein
MKTLSQVLGCFLRQPPHAGVTERAAGKAIEREQQKDASIVLQSNTFSIHIEYVKLRSLLASQELHT